MAQTIEIEAFAGDSYTDHWWQWALIGVLIASAFAGLLTIGLWLLKVIRKRRQVRIV